ncbi:MAG: fumarate hydratase [Candidatus Makaraimicrobium thalassicum]|nr:MAG: fumarate hydratase [Candidatus Omnitrophota bacterium]
MTAREVKIAEIEKAVKALCVRANTVLRPDVLEALEEIHGKEKEGTLAKKMLGILLENAGIAAEERIPICQDTGMVTVFIEMGKDVVVRDGRLPDAVNRGVEQAYEEGCFRKSVVEDPLMRNNTGTNTPAVIHMDIVDGDTMAVSVIPKGFGSENKSRISMLDPTCGPERIIDFCVETVRIAGPDACPPYILGVGLGGTMESCAALAKKALLRPINEPNRKPHIAELERGIKERANALGIGIMGLGGGATVMGVNIEEAPTHIAGLPVAVNLSCHALRSGSAVI